jgi:hypothetical protein
VAREPASLVEIYLNYDCDVDGKDVFEQMISAVARAVGATGPAQHRLAAVQVWRVCACCVGVLMM